MKRFALLTLVVCFASFAHPTGTVQEPTGVKLLEECQTAAKNFDNAPANEAAGGIHCLGYLSGVDDTLTLWRENNAASIKGNAQPPACIPSATMLELAKVVVKYLNDHPNQLHKSYSELVVLALSDAYPCQSR